MQPSKPNHSQAGGFFGRLPGRRPPAPAELDDGGPAPAENGDASHTDEAAVEKAVATIPATAAELAGLAQALAQQAAELRRQWQELSAALADAVPDEAPALPPIRPPATVEGPVHHQPEHATETNDPIKLVALSMAAAQSSRGEVESYLRDRLGVSDCRELLDDIFGIGSSEPTLSAPRRRGLFARSVPPVDPEVRDAVGETRDSS